MPNRELLRRCPLIGRGRQGEVYLYKDAAYKVYRPDYPASWVRYEIEVQQEIGKTSLPMVRYWETEDPLIIKMAYIPGQALGERVAKDLAGSLARLAALHLRVHAAKWVKLARARAALAARDKGRAMRFAILIFVLTISFAGRGSRISSTG